MSLACRECVYRGYPCPDHSFGPSALPPPKPVIATIKIADLPEVKAEIVKIARSAWIEGYLYRVKMATSGLNQAEIDYQRRIAERLWDEGAGLVG